MSCFVTSSFQLQYISQSYGCKDTNYFAIIKKKHKNLLKEPRIVQMKRIDGVVVALLFARQSAQKREKRRDDDHR